MANYIDLKNEYDINWDSTIKTGDFTAESSRGYFIDTSSAVVTMTLPASPSAGDFVAVKDYARNFGTNKLVIDRNGENIQGNASQSELDQNGDTAVLVYADSTKGWLYTQENTVPELPAAEYIVASGGTETTCGDYKIHTFNSSGTFTVNAAGNACGSDSVDYMIIAGGGGGGYGTMATPGNPISTAGGAGAGGFRESVPSPAAWTASPIANPGGALPVSATSYPITVGGGGTAPTSTNSHGGNGSNSVFSTITSTGGGGGRPGYGLPPTSPAGSGGSGGGGSGAPGTNGPQRASGSGNSPPVSPPQGNPGTPGEFGTTAAGGGGGATQSGQPTPSPSDAGPGGAGATTSITGSPVAYAGGGGGGGFNPGGGQGGSGGGGVGGWITSPTPNSRSSGAGATNKGGGGGGGSAANVNNPHAPFAAYRTGGNGGSGKVVIRYKFQN